MIIPDISILIVAYNSDMKVFSRCLKAISRLKRDNLNVEVLLIDNNSRPALSVYPQVQQFLQECPNSRILVETKQGSGYARICGFHAAAAPLIVTFDDDNEPEENYLLGVKNFFEKNPELGVAGPGIIKVDYFEGCPAYFEKFRYVFQEVRSEKEEITRSQWPDKAYPYGTGMAMRKNVAIDYSRKVESGQFSSIGRINNILTSGEDMQLVWNCLKNSEFAVGVSPSIQLRHLIGRNKANFNYWRKLSFGGGYSWATTRMEIFPEELPTIQNTAREIRKSFFRIAKVFVFNFYRPRFFIISLASQVGVLHGIYRINRKAPPFFLNVLKSILRVD